MAERTKGLIEIVRDHPNPATNQSMLTIRPVGWKCASEEIATIFSAPDGSDRHANAEFLVLAWGAHDQLVAENAALREQLSMPDPVRDRLVAALKDCARHPRKAQRDRIVAKALAAAGVTP